MTPRTVIEWYKLICAGANDLDIVRQAVRELDDPNWGPLTGPREEHLLTLLTAVRIDQMAKEGMA